MIAPTEIRVAAATAQRRPQTKAGTAAHYLHDGAQPEGSGQRTRWGNCWVVVVLVVNLDCLDGRPVGLPILFRLFRPKDDEHPDRPSQPVLARTLIDVVLARFPTRIVELVMDGAYATSQGLARAARARDSHDQDARQRCGLQAGAAAHRQAWTTGAQRRQARQPRAAGRRRRV